MPMSMPISRLQTHTDGGSEKKQIKNERFNRASIEL